MYQRAIVRAFGEASDVVELEPCVLGDLADDRVRLRMISRSINPSDIITISGAYRSRTALPFLPGYEGVGVVEEVGRSVRGFSVGDTILPIGEAGTWQAFKDADPGWCLKVPCDLSEAQAATSYVNPMTAWVMFHDIAKARPGAKIAVTAAGSAIGRMLIGLANEKGIEPLAFVRSRTSVARLAELRCRIVQYGSEAELEEIVKSMGEGLIDRIFDCVGGKTAFEVSRLLTSGGQFVHFGLLSGTSIAPEFWAGRPDMAFSMFHLREWVRKVPFETVIQTYQQVASLVSSGILSSQIRATYPLRSITEALLDARDYKSDGKVLISG